jgi:AsmA family protein
VLTLKPVDVGVAGGHVLGQFTFDGKQKALSAHAKIDLKDVRLEELLSRLSRKQKGAGPLQGHLDMKGQGDSIAKITASSSGLAQIDMAGGAISNLLDAEIGLNAGKALKALVTGDRAIGINSATAAFDFDKGLGKSKSILLDTDQTHTEGTGIIDLRDETVDLLLTPHPKKTALLALHSSIRIHGPIRKPKFSLAKNP